MGLAASAGRLRHYSLQPILPAPPGVSPGVLRTANLSEYPQTSPVSPPTRNTSPGRHPGGILTRSLTSLCLANNQSRSYWVPLTLSVYTLGSKSKAQQSGLSCFLSSRLHVGVEDGQSETYILVTVVVSPHMTIAQLKDKVPVFQPTKQVIPVLFFTVLFSFTLLSTFKNSWSSQHHWFTLSSRMGKPFSFKNILNWTGSQLCEAAALFVVVQPWEKEGNNSKFTRCTGKNP